VSVELDQQIDLMMWTARRRKANAREWMQAMVGDADWMPSRGPILPNGRYCQRWSQWEAARKRHRELGRLIAGLIALRRQLGKEGA
jgi:hypothetical protein